MKLFQFYSKRYPCDPYQFRVWRTRLYINTRQWRGHWAFGFEIGAGGLALNLIAVCIRLHFWSHKDDCDCDRCLPF